MEFTLINLWVNCARLYASLNNQGGFNTLNVGRAPDDVTVTFPIAFNKDNPTLTCSTVFQVDFDDGWSLTSLHAISKSKFKCKSAQNDTIGFKWIAFGI